MSFSFEQFSAQQQPKGFDLDSLNPAQKEAVMTTRGPLLVLAGAGSGKTRVLTHRIAHMIADEGVNPWEILAITFTNKAAAEMRERLGSLLGPMRGMWVCTFHAMCVRMLREDADRLGYTKNFTIYDDQDSRRLVKTIMVDLHINDKEYPLNMMRSMISTAKNDLKSPDTFLAHASSPAEQAAGRIYKELQERLLRANAMDFDDLLFNTYKLLSNNSDVLEGYQNRFIQISVDEYQDTNHAQYQITNLLAAKHHNLMVVGDDDQSIYSWRGADISNILNFEKDYPEAKIVKLEQNYRSTAHILEAANAVVAHNLKRKNKTLYTDLGDGELIQVYQASDERDEGRWIASEIEKLRGEQDMSYNDMAIMYRTNAQSRILEDMCLRAGVPYKIVGGTRFFDRAEIRDVTAYLKLICNPNDDISCLRIINTPKRGIGASSIAKIQQYAWERRIPFFSAAQECVLETGLLSAKCRNSLAEFCSGIEASRALTGDLADVIADIIDRFGIIAALKSEHTMESESRIENILEFIDVAREFDEKHEDAQETLETLLQLKEAGALGDVELSEEDIAKQAEETLSQGVSQQMLPAFMEWLALRSDLDNLAGETSAVTMMTVHSSKGLEYPAVFVAGMEEGIFPHNNHAGDQGALEEERRLAYVAITRARKRLYMTYAASRRTYGQTMTNPPSRFVREIPSQHVNKCGLGSMGMRGTGWEKRGDRRGTFGSGQGSSMYGGNVFGSATRSTNRKTTSAYAAPTISRSEQLDTQKAEVKRDSNSIHSQFAQGDKISHKTFGPGVVVELDGDMIKIKFDRTGETKRLMVGYAPITKIG